MTAKILQPSEREREREIKMTMTKFAQYDKIAQ